MTGGFHLSCIYVHCAISARSTKFDVVVFKASMLDRLGGSICHAYMCIVLYLLDLPSLV